MPINTIAINEGRDLEEDFLYDIQDELSNESRGRKGGGSGKKGRKTLRALGKQNVENAEEKRKEEASSNIINDLKNFPFKKLNEVDYLEDGIKDYAKWVVEAISHKYSSTFNIVDLSKDVEYSSTKSSGPGGQNVNKRNTAVFAKHVLTGIYVKNSERRSFEKNKRTAQGDVEKRLRFHVKNWDQYLNTVSVDQKEGEVRVFMTNFAEEKLE